jgi:L-fuculose-phosphate aldolase
MRAAWRPLSDGRLAAIRKEIVDVGIELERIGLLDLTAGNISVRVDEQSIAITPSGIPYTETTAADIVVCRLDDGAVLDGHRKPSSELPLHSAVYTARPETGAVVHTHSPYATTLAVLQQPIPAVHYIIARLGTCAVPVVDYATYGSDELAQNAFAALAGGTRALLLANHGTLTIGDDLETAAANARILEILATTYWRALAVGTPAILPDDEIASVRERHKTYGQSAP